MPDIWSWFLIKAEYTTENICHNANTELCSLCQDDCNLARGHGLTDDFITRQIKRI